MPETINPDGSSVLIEAVFYRHYCVEAEEFDSIEDAIGFLDNGEEYGTLASVGVFVDGEPHAYGYTDHRPDAAQIASMREDYAKAKVTG